MRIVIRKADKQDALLLANMGRDIFYRTFAAANDPGDMALYLAEAFTEEKLLQEFDEPGALFYIAEVEGNTAGYAKLGRKRTPPEIEQYDCMELERIYVYPEYQQQKVGYALMQLCIKTARHTGCDILWLGVWEHHPTAVRFYEKVGFRRFGQHIFQFGNDPQTDMLMKLEII
jgi:GNAT superfamily N-acetyltransferase